MYYGSEFEKLDILDENQLYYLTKICIIAFFAKGEDKLNEYGFSIKDFPQCMKFVKEIYFEHVKNREDIQK